MAISGLRRTGLKSALVREFCLLPAALAAVSVLCAQQVQSLHGTGSVHAADAEEVKLFVELGSNEMPGGIAFSPHGDWILTNYNGNANLWETATGREIRHFDSTHQGIGNDAAYSPTGDKVALISNDTVLLVDPRSGEITCEIHAGPDDSYESVAFSPDGDSLLTGSKSWVNLWKSATCEETRHWFISKDAIRLSVTFSKKGDLFAAGAWDGQVYVWDLPGGGLLTKFQGDDEYVNSVAFSGDGERLLVGGTKNQAALWDWRQGHVTQRYLGHTEKGVTMAGFSPTGDRVLTANDDYTAILYETDSGKVIHTFGTESDHTNRDVVTRAIFSPDGRFILTDSFDRSATLWDATTFEVRRGLDSHVDGVNAVATSHDGGRLAAALDGSGVAVWDLRVGGEIVV